MKFLSVFFFLNISNLLIAQPYFYNFNDIPVKLQNNDSLELPWTGGLNNPQFSSVDLNHDAINDLVVFDRAGDQLLTFLNHGTVNESDYTYNPEFENNFPILKSWVLLYDMNCDGIEDILTSSPGASDNYINYYEASYNADDEIQFNYRLDLLFEDLTGSTTIMVSKVDIPGFADVNGDGDLDVLTFAPTGGHVEYFENQSMELTGTCSDSIYFEMYDACWGNFFESGVLKPVDLNISCNHVVQNGEGARHVGSTVLALNIDADEDFDLVLGDLSFSNLNMLKNGGTNLDALITYQDTAYPYYSIPTEITQWPAPFYEDVNNDGIRDLISAPNAQNISENFRCVWLFENEGTDDSLDLNFIADTFFVGDMIDVGEHSYPVMFDINADGLKDLLIGNHGYYLSSGNFKSSLAYLQNTGSASFPSYQLISRDYEGISSLNLNDVYPAFGDLDGDGDDDMLVGEADGEMHFFTNSEGAGNPANFSLSEVNFEDIDIGQNSIPVLIDLTNDGLLDLVIGERNGSLNFLENEGTSSEPSFIMANIVDGLGGVDVRESGFTTGHTVPYFYDLNDGLGLTLFVGSERGWIYRYDDFEGNLNGSFTLLNSTFSEKDYGIFAAPWFEELNGDTSVEFLVGNNRGGIVLMREGDAPPVGVQEIVHDETVLIYPNPSDEYFTLSVSDQENSFVSIFNLTGQIILVSQISSLKSQILTRDFNSGIYFVRINFDNGKSVTRKLIVQH